MVPLSGRHTPGGAKRRPVRTVRLVRFVRLAPAAVLASGAMLLTNGSLPAAAQVRAPAEVTAAAVTALPARADDERLALDTLDEVVRGDFAAVSARFDGTLRHQASPEALAQAWKDYQEQYGPYRSHGDPRQVTSVHGSVVNVPLHMEKGTGEFRVTFNEGGHLIGLYFLRTGIPVP
ncbi:DUF3887 domain-containing protein [Streptomyces sp. NBC_00347]|uniref:DUF3887 domain-containing protein n=1 Tax=Streptomyces sp. NBC_00347 TaxID=2975721 RepID=UPI00225B35EB|nr:DUF3887 domain-containing protein [Streptomyces sp. NBC_00347]MCX5128178.1 DUF3887 domain-containing protein [Streptomyces sp. NBC_00347]